MIQRGGEPDEKERHKEIHLWSENRLIPIDDDLLQTGTDNNAFIEETDQFEHVPGKGIGYGKDNPGDQEPERALPDIREEVELLLAVLCMRKQVPVHHEEDGHGNRMNNEGYDPMKVMGHCQAIGQRVNAYHHVYCKAAQAVEEP